MAQSSSNDQELDLALQEVDKLRAQVKRLQEELSYKQKCVEYHCMGLEARRRGDPIASNPFSFGRALTPIQLKYRECWMLGWREQDRDSRLLHNNTKLQKALVGLLEIRRIDKGRLKGKFSPDEVEVKRKKAWKLAFATMKEVNRDESNG